MMSHPAPWVRGPAMALLASVGACGVPEVEPALDDDLAIGEQLHAVTVAVRVTPTVTGRLQTLLSTTVQPQPGNYNFFQTYPAAKTLLANRNIQRIHIQPHSTAIPLSAPNTWSFTNVDSLIQPILPLGDRSPQYHALAPDFMLTCGSSSCTVPTSSFPAYSSYLQNLVRYYNTGGFDVGGRHFQSPSTIHIPYWAIYDEPNINGFTGARYAQLYNSVVPAMRAVDPAIKIVAMEVDDWDGNDPSSFIRTFAQQINATAAPASVLGAHFYASCNQRDTDQELLWEAPVLVQHLRGYRTALAGTALANTPIWLTESNVNADFDRGDGISNCNPGQSFVVDRRGSNAFFAAWRPYTFSQVVRSGTNVTGFFQFQFAEDAQYGEVNQATGTSYLSYWVDYWLDRYLGYRADTGKGANLLTVQNPDEDEIEVLAAKKDVDGSVVIMVVNHALRATGDNNGPGAARTVSLDLNAFPTFTSATRLTIDKNTSASTGPTAVTVTPAKTMSVTLGGYGVTFLSLR